MKISKLKYIVIYLLLFILCAYIISYLTDSLELKSYDSRLRIKRKIIIPDTSNILIAAIDDETFQHNKTWKVSRQYCADLLSYLEKTQACAIGVDIDFDFNLDKMTPDDKKLYKILALSKKIIPAKSINDLSKTNLPLNYGFIDIPQDKDGVIRKYWPTAQINNQTFDSFALKILKKAQMSKVKPLPAIARNINTEQLYPWFYINYPGPAQSIKMISACYIKNVPAEFFRDKIVFVGNTSCAQGKDYYHTPFFKKAAEKSLMSGVEINADAFYTIFSGDYIHKTTNLTNNLIILFWSLFVFLIILNLNFLWGLIFTILLTIAYTIFAYYVFVYHNYWIPLSAIQITTPFCYLFTAQLKIKTSESAAEKFKKFSSYIASELFFFYKKSITDKLTGIYNFAYLKEKLDEMVKENKIFSLAIIDIDHFKKYNDQNGHQAGNEALIKTVDIFRENIDPHYFLSRYGGEEFVIIFTDVPKEEAFCLAENIRKKVESAHYKGGPKQPLGKVTVSIGLSEFPKDSTDVDELLELADSALYRAKESGRNKVIT